jgi:acyl-CoA thioester hydrolase
MGVAHHAAYIPWLEMGRTELLRATGITYAHLEQAGVFLVVTSLEMKYRRPVFYDDVVEIRTRVGGGSRVKILHSYEVALAADGGHTGARAARSVGDVLAVGASTLACVGRDGRVQQLPEWLVPSSPPPT